MLLAHLGAFLPLADAEMLEKVLEPWRLAGIARPRVELK
jgi:hypothetical protein